MKKIFLIAVSLLLAGCATSYQSSSLSGGYQDMHIGENVYRVAFSANGYATRETAQTYWLYRATELTLEKGYDGFEILSPLALGKVEDSYGFVNAQLLFIPMERARKPYFEADIRMLKAPFKAQPPKIFNAVQLKADLEPHVKGEKKCKMENVCPHIKKYLYPPAPADIPASRDPI